MTTLVRSFIPGVQHLLQDRNPPYRRWPEKDVVRAINFGLRALYKFVPTISTRRVPIQLDPGSRQDIRFVPASRLLWGFGEGRGVSLIRVLGNMGALATTRGRTIRTVDRDTKSAFSPNWRSDEGDEVREVIVHKESPTEFDVWPRVPEPWWIEIEAMWEPNPIPDGGAPGFETYAEAGTSTTVLPIEDRWVEDLTHYVCAYLLMAGGKTTVNVAKAQMHEAAFLRLINSQSQATSRVNPNLKTLPFIEEQNT